MSNINWIGEEEMCWDEYEKEVKENEENNYCRG
jgi:hypothetical protein